MAMSPHTVPATLSQSCKNSLCLWDTASESHIGPKGEAHPARILGDFYIPVLLCSLSKTALRPYDPDTNSKGSYFLHTEQFSDTSWVSYNSTQF